MATWPLSMRVSRDESTPRFLQIAHAVMEDIRRGRLVPGQRLPGTRTWARSLGVNRNTVIAAVAELEAQGWIQCTPTRGTWVRSELPSEVQPPPGHRGLAPLTIPLKPAPAFLGARRFTFDDEVLHLSAGAPDPRLFPVELLSRTWRRVVKRRGRRLLEYGDPAGAPSLRAALARMLSDLRGVPAGPDDVVVTRGSQMALDLLARAVLEPGDVVAVEAYGYRPAWEALRLAGARLLPVPVDGEGLDVDALGRLAARRKLRAVYVTPHHQYPTTVTLAAARRLALLELARRHRFLVIEDDYDHEFHYDGRPVLPLLASDEAGVVASIGTLSKVLAPGLRLGFVVAPAPLAARLARLRAAQDRQGDHPMEACIAELLEEGELQRHVRKMRVVYQGRRDLLVRLLRSRLGDALSFDVPAGGISLWVRTREPRLDDWLASALRQGVHITPGRAYRIDGVEPGAMRLVFARFNEGELARAVDVLERTRP